MRFEDIDPAAIDGCWGWLGALLAPAIAHDASKTPDMVRDHLKRGRMRALRLIEGGDGVIVVERSGDTLFLCYVAGHLDGGPKERAGKYRAIVEAFRTEAARIGCTRLRGGGRDWLGVLEGWEPVGDGDFMRDV